MGIQLSSFEVMRLVQELGSLEGAFLQKVYQPMEGLLVFRLNTKAGKRFLVHRIGKWLYVTDELDIDLEPMGSHKMVDLPGFVKLLRKHLSNGYMTGARQVSFDRVIELGVRKDLPYVLVFELFGSGNVILTKQGTIVGTLRTQVWRSRTIRGGSEYRPPPLRNDPRTLGQAELAVLLNQSRADLIRTLATAVNLGGTYAEEVCHRAGLEKSMMPRELGPDMYTTILDAIQEITQEVTGGTGGFIHTVGGSRVEVTAVRLKKYGQEPVETFPELGQAIRQRFPLIELKESLAPPTNLETIMERLRHQKAQQVEALERFDEEIADAKAKAEALYINYKPVESVLEQINALRETSGWKEVVGSFPDLEIDPTMATVLIELEGPEGTGSCKVRLDLRKNINENAQELYEHAKHHRDKIAGAKHALAETRKEIKRLEGLLEEEAETKRLKAEEPGRKRAGRRRFWFEGQKWFVSRDGNVIVGGKDAQGNRKVVKRYLRSGDRYIHADIHGASSIVVKAADVTGRPLDISEATLEEACHFSICHSKAWSARIGSGEAYWVKPEQVSTRPQSGEFLPKGGFIIRGKRNYIRNLKLELGIGPVELEGVEVVMCAPVVTMEARSERFFTIMPSKGKKTDVAKELAREFDVPIEEIEAKLPPGGLKVVGGPGSGSRSDI